MYYFAILFGTLIVTSSVDGRLRDLFNSTADNNLGQLMDTMATLATNNIYFLMEGAINKPIEELVLFLCGHRNSTELKETTVDDPEISSKLDFTKPVAFITHGWTDNAKKLWIQTTAQKMIRYLDRNVCVVQWRQLAAYKYEQAAKENTLQVSDYLTKFIQYLVQKGVELKDIILVGHSLGAHIMGQTGRNFNGEIGQIYGLDPARAFFTAPVDRGLEVRLDSTDAKYVQMIITTRGMSGVPFGEGHDNFYPNGGTNPQPHCIFPLVSDAEFANQLICSHIHSTTLFRLSLSPWTLYLGHECDSYAKFVLGLCKDSKPNKMGVYSNQAGGDFYLTTSLKSSSEYLHQEETTLDPSSTTEISANSNEESSESKSSEEIVSTTAENFDSTTSTTTESIIAPIDSNAISSNGIATELPIDSSETISSDEMIASQS